MAISLKFYLKRPKEDKETSIFFLMNYGAYTLLPNGKKKYMPLKYYTTESILPKKWDAKKGEPLAPTAKNKRINSTEYKELKAKLERIEAVARDTYRRLENDGCTITNELLTLELDKVLKGKNEIKDVTTHDLLAFIDDYIQKSDKSIGTKKQYKVTRNKIVKYMEFTNHKRPTFEDITLDYYLGFTEFLKQQEGYAMNTIGTRIKDLKLFMNEAHERGLHDNLDFRKKRFAKPHEDTEAIYLDIEEVKQLYNFDFSKNKKLERVRDLFIIGCCTGLRFSDLSSLCSDNINEEEGLISVRTKKTDKLVVIPIHAYVRQILQKYDNRLPKMPSNQKFNEYIKEAAKRAGISKEVTIHEKKENLSYTKAIPKYSLISSHTARRSFATNAYKSGIPAIDIMKITGHKTEAAFMKYIKITEEENALKLQNSAFFNPLTIVK